jgi:hypothetical protein
MARMMHGVLVILAILFAILWIAHSTIMLISPKFWFRMPSRLGVHGTMTERKYGKKLGYLKVRLLGAIFLSGALWVIYDAFFAR